MQTRKQHIHCAAGAFSSCDPVESQSRESPPAQSFEIFIAMSAPVTPSMSSPTCLGPYSPFYAYAGAGEISSVLRAARPWLTTRRAQHSMRPCTSTMRPGLGSSVERSRGGERDALQALRAVGMVYRPRFLNLDFADRRPGGGAHLRSILSMAPVSDGVGWLGGAFRR
jgi:hypothetical protein